VRHQSKWKVKFAGLSTTDPWISLSDRVTEEEVTCPIGRDRAKAMMWKGEGKKDLSSQSESSYAVGDMMSTLKRLSTSFDKAWHVKAME
jgi:hypothetical protein